MTDARLIGTYHENGRTMETRKVGSLDVSVVGLGTNNFGVRLDETKTKDVLDAAIDNGINFLDTADVYGATKSETFIGDLLGSRRSNVVLATKFGMSVGDLPAGGSPAYVEAAIEGSLKRLRTDYIDLYIYHRPDPTVPIADTLAALGKLISAGKVREIGCSNFSVAQLREAEAAMQEGAPRIVNLQNNYSLMHRDPERGVLAECVRQSIAFVPYFPLATGLLTGKFRRGAPMPEGTRIAKMPEERRQQTLNDRNIEIVEQLIEFVTSRGHTLLELAFSWLLAQPAVASVIAGASTRDQVAANAAATGWVLSGDELAEVSEITAACLPEE